VGLESGPFLVKCVCACVCHHTAWRMRYLSHTLSPKLLLWESHCSGPDGGSKEREKRGMREVEDEDEIFRIKGDSTDLAGAERDR